MKIFCVGRNYAEHAKELGNAIPEEPVIFMKPKSALLQTNVPFYYPEFTNELHYEAELVFQISKNGKYIKQKDAPHFYNKITVGIDFTARDIQNELKKKGLPWEKAKAWDQSAVVGKWMPVEKDRMKQPIEFSLYKNNEQVQLGNTSQMIYSVDYLIAHISNYFSLNIGDLIFTGTPAGVGECVVGDELTGFLGEEKMFELTIK
ncbi:MAG: 2-hydroxyhepta-2,4-diene-1,7-dioate isomerase [Hydrotalea flava]|uniref:fumarylacetoacetate hydrolase family protein n=1 Tax=Hydrotalea flava TaxID=714549 RepID=UPI0008317F91|nr:fumarylacetoacetate hydrolase family protein [Hydrotalea flava]RTL51586.1 MAG: FAA hydrolase family protein [Sphingobacteriales bacterium]NIM35182.1 2-hydroxyhepta-2,4-diene-1,7-dioate isomerase [Hydrotalea flava]NIM38004.1 2-hydroxyhepta-2,4-diene-1,7-dioate isomerase [Hydrotalea flava]NIN03172.1 2-hydroxyhepta-2,4-diene-1,7-dioate isomerase [Hydrotalea flava]NIN14862.1 2-hydroxyhepta-2,4-diene-1,7-dioate isomerase [Hydrotalea flava]